MYNIVDKKWQIEKINKSFDIFKEIYNSKDFKFRNLGNFLERQANILKSEYKKTTLNKIKLKRGNIIMVDFGINLGSELSGIHFAIVLNNDDNYNVDNVTVIPLTSKPGYKRLKLGMILKRTVKNRKNTYALITQVTTISKKKIIGKKFGYFVDNITMKKIMKALIYFFTDWFYIFFAK